MATTSHRRKARRGPGDRSPRKMRFKADRTAEVLRQNPLQQGEYVVVIPVAPGAVEIRRSTDVNVVLAELAASAARPRDTRSLPPLTKERKQILNEGGLPEASQEDFNASTEEAIQAFAGVLRDSLSVTEGASLLRVDPSRIRQRLSQECTLYGVKVSSEWKLPRFQFGDARDEVPNIGKVIACLSPELHPLTVVRWFTLPSSELHIQNRGEACSPRQWLLAGGAPEPLMKIASQL